MKTLIVYYSRTGVTKKVAEILRQKLNCDVEEIIDNKNRKGPVGYMLSGREAMKKITPPIEPLTKNIADYDLVIVGTPVWAFTMSSPIRTFLTEQKDKIKKTAFFVTESGSGHEKTFQYMAEIIDQQPIATLNFITTDVIKGNPEEKICQFVSRMQ